MAGNHCLHHGLRVGRRVIVLPTAVIGASGSNGFLVHDAPSRGMSVSNVSSKKKLYAADALAAAATHR